MPRVRLVFTPPEHPQSEFDPDAIAGVKGDPYPFDGTMTYRQLRTKIAGDQEAFDDLPQRFKSQA